VLVKPNTAEKRIKKVMLTAGRGSVPLNEKSLTITESKSTTVRKAKMMARVVFLVRFRLAFTNRSYSDGPGSKGLQLEK
jgi:hypothetical protein